MSVIKIEHIIETPKSFPIFNHPTFHTHTAEEMLIVKSGNVVAMSPNSYVSHKGACIIYYKNNTPHTQINDPDTLYERYCIQFDRNIISHLYSDMTFFSLLHKEEAFILPITESELEILWKATNLLRKGLENKANQNNNILFNYIFAEITRIAKSSGNLPTISNFYLTSVAQYIVSNIDKKLTIDEISLVFNVSRAKLTRDFRKFFSMTVTQYIMAERLIKAKILMLKGVSISQTCEMCGFGDTSYFIQVFKKQFAITPLKFIQQNSENYYEKSNNN